MTVYVQNNLDALFLLIFPPRSFSAYVCVVREFLGRGINDLSTLSQKQKDTGRMR